MSTNTATLMGRTEEKGKAFPLWIERLLLASAVVVFLLYRRTVLDAVDHAVLGALVAYVVFPLTLLALVEVLGRTLQRSLRS
jgi:hypothetical protein